MFNKKTGSALYWFIGSFPPYTGRLYVELLMCVRDGNEMMFPELLPFIMSHIVYCGGQRKMECIKRHPIWYLFCYYYRKLSESFTSVITIRHYMLLRVVTSQPSVVRRPTYRRQQASWPLLLLKNRHEKTAFINRLSFWQMASLFIVCELWVDSVFDRKTLCSLVMVCITETASSIYCILSMNCRIYCPCCFAIGESHNQRL